MLEARSLSKRFPGVRALHRVQLTLQAGEVLAVIGENGAGKSTLMKILAGVQEPDEGEILLDGRTVRIDSVLTSVLGAQSSPTWRRNRLASACNWCRWIKPRRCGSRPRKTLEATSRLSARLSS